MSKKEEPSDVAVIPTEPAAVAVATYRDKVFTSRTLVLPSGKTVKVKGGRIAAEFPELRDYLARHPEFEPVKD
jgi:hypothetical protein